VISDGRTQPNWQGDVMDKLERLHFDINGHLVDIEKLFNRPVKITLVVRMPDMADGGVLLSNDDIQSAIAEIVRLKDKATV